ncbi:hypothetical protein HOM50_00175 [bacterium]|nr:hypothetical protein [bacterium]MBT5014812.1 hypothetical protein [bacterium]
MKKLLLLSLFVLIAGIQSTSLYSHNRVHCESNRDCENNTGDNNICGYLQNYKKCGRSY